MKRKLLPRVVFENYTLFLLLTHIAIFFSLTKTAMIFHFRDFRRCTLIFFRDLSITGVLGLHPKPKAREKKQYIDNASHTWQRPKSMHKTIEKQCRY